MKVMITGSSGLIGRHLGASLARRGIEVAGFDIRETDQDGRSRDVRNADQVENAIAGCDGIVHLAAVSRVLWGQRDPELCRSVNVDGTNTLYRAAAASNKRPFVIFGSSREVYGHPQTIPVAEDCAVNPCNVYGETKVQGEILTHDLSAAGLNSAVFRFSNVYGWAGDHHDRVVPAFAREAASGRKIRVDGKDCVFDFTHIRDVTRALVRAVEAMSLGERLPPIHLVSGQGTSLGELADLAVRTSDNGLEVVANPPRDFDVARFCGDGARARDILGWQPEISLESGFARLVDDFRNHRDPAAMGPNVRLDELAISGGA